MHNKLKSYLDYLNEFFLGKDQVVKLVLSCMLARGHVLIEDIPGVGKTTLILLIAKTLGIPVNRIQLTSDLLPADIIGNLVFNTHRGEFEVRKGPIFSNIILADELNRATPKTQSAFLQAMEEGTVNIDDKSYPLPNPFIICATQNPNQLVGTFLLPESQLDRFMMKLRIGFPDSDFEKKLLSAPRRKENLKNVKEWFSLSEIISFQDEVEQVFVSPAIIDYVEQILQASRMLAKENKDHRVLGLSPRAGLSIVDAAKSWAYLDGRDRVYPGDVQKTCVEVMIHRMYPDSHKSYEISYSSLKNMIERIPVD